MSSSNDDLWYGIAAIATILMIYVGHEVFQDFKVKRDIASKATIQEKVEIAAEAEAEKARRIAVCH